MSNRVEDLERQVAELQAAVNGLTEELVEMKERVRQVEDAQEVSVTAAASEEPAPAGGEAAGGETRTHSDDHVEVVERTGGDETAQAADDASAEGDADVPEQPATTAEGEAEEGAETNEESDNDIIVA